MDYYICKDINKCYLTSGQGSKITMGVLGIVDSERYTVKKFHNYYCMYDLTGKFKLTITRSSLKRYFYSLKEYRKRKLLKLNECRL
jgi:hypothetical protein